MSSTPIPPPPSASSVSPDQIGTNLQYGRYIQLLVVGATGTAINLSSLRIKFAIKRSGVMTPNVADIRIYNVSSDLAAKFKNNEFTKVILDAGYVNNYGTIFLGNIKQSTVGRESATDTFVNIQAGDGDLAYNFATVTIPVGGNGVGSTPTAQLQAALASLGKFGIVPNYIGTLPTRQLPRGKVMYGNAREILRSLADSHGFTWSIQDEQVIFISEESYLPGQAQVMNSKNGMIGTPQQLIDGIQCKCLLNPNLKCHGLFQVDNALVAAYQLNILEPGSPANYPVQISGDGYYVISVVEHFGDTRGQEWSSNVIGLTFDISSNPLDSQPIGEGIE